MKKFIALLLCGILTATALTGCGSSSAGGENGEVIVYNWGEYIDPETLTMFEEETGIKVRCGMSFRLHGTENDRK